MNQKLWGNYIIMIDELVLRYLSLSDKLRNGYKNSLGIASHTWNETLSRIIPVVPEAFRAIYGKIAGTYRNIGNQKYMDFVPGYRLIHIEELENEYHTLLHMLVLDDISEAEIRAIMPLLADGSSCYICYVETKNNEEAIFHYSPHEGLQMMHTSIELFFKTIIAFYQKGVFYLDQDGFLDYDFEQEGLIGAEYNPGIDYWTE